VRRRQAPHWLIIEDSPDQMAELAQMRPYVIAQAPTLIYRTAGY
jgi:hypothetical protein